MSRSTSAIRVAGAALALVLGVALALAVTVVVGIRTRNPTVLRHMHRYQRDSINPRALAAAGRPGSPHAILRHVGRTSGREYETPVGALVTGDRVAIALVYGPEVDWARNILAAGQATIVVDGDELQLTDPAVVPLDESPLAGTMDVTARIFAITHALVLTVRSAPATRS